MLIEVALLRLGNAGTNHSDVYQTLQAYLGGLFLNQFNRFGRQWRVFIQAEGEERLSDSNISQYYVRSERIMLLIRV